MKLIIFPSKMNYNTNPRRAPNHRPTSGTARIKQNRAKLDPDNLPVIEIIKNRLYWISGSKPPTSTSEAYFFCVDDELFYDPFNNDFGPLSLAQVHKYIRELVRLLVDP